MTKVWESGLWVAAETKKKTTCNRKTQLAKEKVGVAENHLENVEGGRQGETRNATKGRQARERLVFTKRWSQKKKPHQFKKEK